MTKRMYRTLGTHYHPTLDPAVLWTPSIDTSRPICSDSLNLMPPAPLYLRTLWRYTNAVLLLLSMSVIWFVSMLCQFVSIKKLNCNTMPIMVCEMCKAVGLLATLSYAVKWSNYQWGQCLCHISTKTDKHERVLSATRLTW